MIVHRNGDELKVCEPGWDQIPGIRKCQRCGEGLVKPRQGPLPASRRWQRAAHIAVKLDPVQGRNVKSNVESDVDLTCSAVIFQPELNSLLGPQSANRRVLGENHHLSSSFSSSSWKTRSSTNGKIVFSVCHFLFAPLSSPRPTLPGSEWERWACNDFWRTLPLPASGLARGACFTQSSWLRMETLVDNCPTPHFSLPIYKVVLKFQSVGWGSVWASFYLNTKTPTMHYVLLHLPEVFISLHLLVFMLTS